MRDAEGDGAEEDEEELDEVRTLLCSKAGAGTGEEWGLGTGDGTGDRGEDRGRGGAGDRGTVGTLFADHKVPFQATEASAVDGDSVAGLFK